MPPGLVDNGALIVCRDLGELSRNAADEFVSVANHAVTTAGRFAVALSGGATPRGLYARLAAPEYRERIPWSRVHIFWGDERCVPPDHPGSNYGMAREALLSKVPVPAANVHRMSGELEPDAAAAEYEAHLKKFFLLSENALPRFDLALLGLGEDGHTASLFPGSPLLQETRRLVAAPYVEKFDAYRLTLTLAVLNAAANAFFLVAGKSKALILRRLLTDKSSGENLPAQRVKPTQGRLVWLVDCEAAAGLGTTTA